MGSSGLHSPETPLQQGRALLQDRGSPSSPSSTASPPRASHDMTPPTPLDVSLTRTSRKRCVTPSLCSEVTPFHGTILCFKLTPFLCSKVTRYSCGGVPDQLSAGAAACCPEGTMPYGVELRSRATRAHQQAVFLTIGVHSKGEHVLRMSAMESEDPSYHIIISIEFGHDGTDFLGQARRGRPVHRALAGRHAGGQRRVRDNVRRAPVVFLLKSRGRPPSG